MNKDFGELTDVDLREAWKSEPHDRAYWPEMADNLHSTIADYRRVFETPQG